MKKDQPYIICHMASTINGKTLSKTWGESANMYSQLYQQCHERFNSQAWLCGRLTMEKDFTEGRQPELTEPDVPIAKTAFIGDHNAKSFAVAVDARGSLGWEENAISGDHIIEVLTEEVSDAYLHFLQKLSISYVFAGRSVIDLSKAISELGTHFPIKTIMLEGGGHINGAFLESDLVNEVSILLLPLADTTPDNPSAFENPATRLNQAALLKLTNVEQLEHDVLWLRYKKSNL